MTRAEDAEDFSSAGSVYGRVKGPGEEQKAYAEKMRALSEIDTERKTFDIRDKIITLSTCTGNENTRYVVQAVQIVPG